MAFFVFIWSLPYLISQRRPCVCNGRVYVHSKWCNCRNSKYIIQIKWQICEFVQLSFRMSCCSPWLAIIPELWKRTQKQSLTFVSFLTLLVPSRSHVPSLPILAFLNIKLINLVDLINRLLGRVFGIPMESCLFSMNTFPEVVSISILLFSTTQTRIRRL